MYGSSWFGGPQRQTSDLEANISGKVVILVVVGFEGTPGNPVGEWGEGVRGRRKPVGSDQVSYL